MTRRPATVALAGALVAGVLSGCGGGSSDDPGAGAGSAPASVSTTATDSPTEPADPASYLPVPDDVELTPPGTALRYRQGAIAAWTPRQDLVGVVGVRVLRVEQTTVEESLAGFQLDAATASSTPYFVTVVVGNGGETDLGGRQLPMYVVDTDDRLVPPTGVDRGFAPCPGSVLPATFAPGSAARSCLIFLVPAGAELASVMFRPPEGVVPITWTGRTRQLADRGKGGKGKGGKGGKGDKGTSGRAGTQGPEPTATPTG